MCLGRPRASCRQGQRRHVAQLMLPKEGAASPFTGCCVLFAWLYVTFYQGVPTTVPTIRDLFPKNWKPFGRHGILPVAPGVFRVPTESRRSHFKTCRYSWSEASAYVPAAVTRTHPSRPTSVSKRDVRSLPLLWEPKPPVNLVSFFCGCIGEVY